VRKTDRRWARFYFDDFIRDYPDVYADNDAFATWMRLLVVSEKAWPAVPELPRSARVKDVHKLRDRGLVALGPDFTFALKGFDAERTRRHATAIAGANASANARANATADVEPIRERERDENESPLPLASEGPRKNGTNPRAVGTNPRAQGTSPRQERERHKRGPTPLHEILSRAAAAGGDG